MRRMLIPCLIPILAMISADAYASRCVDRVALFAQRHHVSIGAPAPKSSPRLDPDLGGPHGRPGVIVGSPSGMPSPISPEASTQGAKGQTILGAPRTPTHRNFSGEELKVHTKAALSSLLNAALAAGQEGRSLSCFKKLNVAQAVLVSAASRPRTRDGAEIDWR